MRHFFNTIVICIALFCIREVRCKKYVLKNPVDLTWYFENTTIYWTGVQPFVFTKMLATVTENNYWIAMNEFCAGEHGGTHIDAPYHFNKNGIKVGQIPLSNLIVQGVVIDISAKVQERGASYALQLQDVEEWAKKHRKIKKNTVALVKFGWSKYYPNRQLYLGTNTTTGALNFPGISAEAAQWFANNEYIVGVGVDVASADPGNSIRPFAHIALNGAGKYIIENVKFLESLPDFGFTLLVMPMNIAEGTGAPLRLVAVPNNFHKFS